MPSFSLNIDVDFEVYCATCGVGLCNNATEGENRHSKFVKVDACPNCMKKLQDEIDDLKAELEKYKNKEE